MRTRFEEFEILRVLTLNYCLSIAHVSSHQFVCSKIQIIHFKSTLP